MRIAVIADAHVGHVAAIWPEKFEYENEEGKSETIAPKRWQKILLQYWNNFWAIPEVKDSEILVNLAESIEGKNDKEWGKNLMTVDLDLQAEAFLALIKPKLNGRKYVSVSGNKYHESGDAETERQIAAALKRDGIKAEWHYVIANRKWGGKIIQLAHNKTDAMLYKSTALDRDSLFLDANEGSKKLDFHIDLVASAHLHTFFLNQNESRISFIAPSWCFWHPIRKFGARGYSRSQPTIGGLVIEIGKAVSVKLFSYPLIHVYDALR